MLDIFYYEAFAEEAEMLKRFLAPGIRAGYTAQTIQETGDADPRARLISIRTQSRIPERWAASLSGILSRSTGYDHLQRYRDATGASLPCGYLPLYCARAVAEQAMLLWMALLRKLPAQTAQFDAFHRDGLTGAECEGKCLVVVGVGHIGHEVVRIGRGLGMQTLGVDIACRHSDVEYGPPEKAFPLADVMVCAMNLTGTNAGYFKIETLRRLKRGALFVNIARGELAPSIDLLEALQEGALGGAGLDVYNLESELAVARREGRSLDHPEAQAVLKLRKRLDVILTPHNAFNTVESVDRKARQSAEQIEHFLAQGRFLWSIPTHCP